MKSEQLLQVISELNLKTGPLPPDLERRVYHIYPRKKEIVVDGFKRYSLIALKKQKLDRSSLPDDVLKAIDEA